MKNAIWWIVVILLFGALLSFCTATAKADTLPQWCFKQVINPKSGKTLYCTRDMRLKPTDERCDCISDVVVDTRPDGPVRVSVTPPDDSEGPTNPVNPVDPIDPVDPTDPTDPTDPECKGKKCNGGGGNNGHGNGNDDGTCQGAGCTDDTNPGNGGPKPPKPPKSPKP